MIEFNEDTEMYWLGCYVKEKGELFKIIEVPSEEIYNDEEDEYEYRYYILGKDKDGNVRELFDPEPYFPKLGYRQADKFVVYLSRSKSRYYKKGLHNNNLLINTPQFEELMAIGKEPFPSFFDILPEQEYPTLSEAINMIESREKWGVALHNWWAIMLKVGNDNPLLYYRLSPVGEVVDGEVKFFKDSSKRKFEWEVKP